MAIAVLPSKLREIEPLREKYRKEMNCQIIHDSIHGRPGWTRELALHLDDSAIGYGSVAVAGPWRDNPALYEFFIEPEQRMRTFEAFTSLLQTCGANIIETQSNARLLPVMLQVFAHNLRTESILFEDAFLTSFCPPGAGFRPATETDAAVLRDLLAIVCGLITTRAGLRLPSMARSAVAPVGCCWQGQSGHDCPEKPTGLEALLLVTQPSA